MKSVDHIFQRTNNFHSCFGTTFPLHKLKACQCTEWKHFYSELEKIAPGKFFLSQQNRNALKYHWTLAIFMLLVIYSTYYKPKGRILLVLDLFLLALHLNNHQLTFSKHRHKYSTQQNLFRKSIFLSDVQN